MDCLKPVKGGAETTKKKKKKKKKKSDPEIPIIAITANAFQSNADACKLAGMNDYITKPVSAVALREVVQKWAEAQFDEDKVCA